MLHRFRIGRSARVILCRWLFSALRAVVWAYRLRVAAASHADGDLRFDGGLGRYRGAFHLIVDSNYFPLI